MAVFQTNLRAPDDGAESLRELARGASVELSPRQVEAAGDLTDHLPLGTCIYVPFIPGASWQDTIRACERIQARGMLPIPHLPARAVSGPGELDEWLSELTGAGVRELMLVAGDRKRPRGIYRDTLDILDSGALVEHGIARVGVAGHPEGHPLANTADLDTALARKMAYATATGTELWIVTQFAFEAEPVLAWLDALQGVDQALPVRVGIPGPARLKTLLGFAVRCGVGASTRALTRRPSVVRLLNNWTPDAMLGALAQHRAGSVQTPLTGIHLFTFGGLPQTSRWLRAKAGVGTAHVVDFAAGVSERRER